MPMPLSSDKLHLTMTKSSTFSGLRDALLAVTTFPAAENTLSDFELAAGTVKTILTRCERSVKYTLQLSWFTLPETRPGTRTFNHYPTRTRSKVKKCYSSCPSDVTWSKITASNSRREGEDTWLWALFGGQGDFLHGSQLGEHQPRNKNGVQ